ncbi:MAG: BatA and WFA domain-containing protein [Planctomycetes bacterium]|nr:BatA and WFA domain-containing protein [Planctomycetota bacterium]
MNWLTPLAGATLAALVIPPLILLYFLKLRRRTQPISCTILWKRAIEDLRANAPFQKLRKSLLLLLQLFALILLALAIMQPQLQAGARRGGNTVILIDNSASMTATDIEGTTRLDDAKRQAKERIEQLYGGGIFGSSAGETMVIAFSDQAQIICRFTDSKPQLLTAIDRIQPTHGLSLIGDALNFARAYTTIVNPEAGLVSHDTTLELYSDGKLADLSDQVLRGEKLVYYAIGKEDADNVAITAISIERPYDRPNAVEVFASLVNFNTDAVVCDLQLSVDGLVRAIEEVSINAAAPDPVTGEIVPERSNVVFTPFEQPRGAVIEIANLREDDLAADNVARLVVPPPKLLKIALVEPVGTVIKIVLEGMTTIASIETIDTDQFEQVAAEEGVDNYDVVIFGNYAPPQGSMPPGRYLSFGEVPPLKGLNKYGEGGSAIILDTKDEHPIFRFVNLDKLYFSKSQLIQPDDDVQVLAETVDGPVIVAISRGSMQAIHVCIDPLDSNWPYLRSWVTFVVNAVEYLGNSGDALALKGFSAGQALTARLPASATEIVLHEPDDSTHQLQPQDPTQLSWGPIRLAGVYGLDWSEPTKSDKQHRLFAVNLLNELEGDIRPEKEIFANEQGNVTIAGSGSSHYTPLWPWAIGICLTVLMLEWWVYHRKAYI